MKENHCHISKFYCRIFFILYFVQKLAIDRKEFSCQGKNDRRIYVLNHSSMYDTVILNVIPGTGKTIVNEKWGSSFFGFIQKMNGNIIIKNEPGISDSFSTIEKIKTKLEKGIPIIIFPEGTRSKTGKIEKFYSGIFRLAIDTKADIVPVVIDNWNTIRPGGLWIRDVKPVIKFLRPIKYEDFKTASHKRISKYIRIKMIQELISIRDERRKKETTYYRKQKVFENCDMEMRNDLRCAIENYFQYMEVRRM
jgi:1-acyl-sn-glycerol-3-phosphate acyltransferase